LVSEVVTNAVRHGCEGPDDRVRLTLAYRDGSIRIEVEDPGDGIPAATTGGDGDDHLRESGWGLLMVDRFASRWGTELEPSRVWFELDVDG
ncbi:MAG TPA: ATP-binding protein, partial [Actinomycetota bacterium]|nr:ATP-binding protein [Actinomycetota bacterium]